MEYKYIKISKCGNWVQSKRDTYSNTLVYYIYGDEIQEACKTLPMHYHCFGSHLEEEEIEEIKHYVMNREVTK